MLIHVNWRNGGEAPWSRYRPMAPLCLSRGLPNLLRDVHPGPNRRTYCKGGMRAPTLMLVHEWQSMLWTTAGTSKTPEVTANMQGGCTRFHIFECFYAESKKYKKNGSPDDLTPSDLTTVLFREMGQQLKDLSPSEEDRLLREVVYSFLRKAMSFYKNCNRNKKRFKDKHGVFLNKLFIDDIPVEFKRVAADFATSSEMSTTSQPLERVVVNFDTSSVECTTELLPESTVPDVTQSAATLLDSIGMSSLGSSKSTNDPGITYKQDLKIRKRIMESLEGEPQAKVIKSFALTITSDDGSKITPKASKDLEKVIKLCLISPKEPSVVLNKISTIAKPYTPEEALGFIIDRQLSVETYKLLRQNLKSRGYPAYPPYYEILNARKACYPAEEIDISEVEASVSLHGLLSHTIQRIVQSCDASFVEYCNRKGKQEVSCVIEGSWGFDGSTGQALYKQHFPGSDEDISKNENSLFATTFLPLRIVIDKHYIAWLNPTPQSYRFYRPLHIQYKKETTNLILEEKAFVEEQIKSLSPITITTETSERHRLIFVCNLTLSIIDGKVLNVITGTSSQLRCPFCKLTASQFNDLETSYTKATIKENMQHGINPLHAWIRIFEFLLHLSYKNDPLVRKWRINKSSREGQIVQERKKRIQAEIRKRIGLLVDVVKPNSGTTNDGNSARTALSDKYRAIFAEILGLDAWLVDGLHIILVVISCEYSIDAKKFGIFCRTLAERYVQSYNWHPMTVTVHKILVHGEEIIESCALPVGMLSEQAAESRNKFWRSDREHHCRKMNRRKTMIDLFHRALESSDPFVSMAHYRQRLKPSSRICLPEAARELLKAIHEENLQVAEVDDEDPALDGSSSLGDDENPSNVNNCTLILENENDLYES